MKKIVFYGLLVSLILLFSACNQDFMQQTDTLATGTPDDGSKFLYWDMWTMFRHDARHTGYASARAPMTPTLLWTVHVGLPMYSSPAIAGRKVFVGAEDVILAFDERNGKTLWKAPIAGEVYSSPAVDPWAGKNGMVYCSSWGSRSSTISAFDMETGEQIWCKYTITKSSPVLAHNIFINNQADDLYPVIPRCTLFTGSHGILYALNADTGETLWYFLADGDIESTPAVDEMCVYFGTNDHMIYALNRYTGEGVWKFEAKGPVISSPAVGDRFLIAASLDGIIYCLDKKTGEPVWTLSTGGRITSSPAYYRGYIYIGSGMELLKLHEGGKVIWRARTLGETNSSPAVSSGRVYIGSSKTESASIFCFDDRSGRKIWSEWMDVEASPSVAYWSLIVPSTNGTLYCFNDLE